MTIATLSPISTTGTGETRRPPLRPVSARVTKRPGMGRHTAEAPSSDHQAWRAQLSEVLATASPEFVDASLAQLVEVCKLPEDGVATATSLTAALALIASLEPENEAQAALAIHVAALHCATLNVVSRMHNIGYQNMVSVGTAAAKLERSFQGALLTYDRLKRGANQVVRVEHVEIHGGGQTVIGPVYR